MKILLDTHYLLWILFDSKKLNSYDKNVIQDKKNEIIFSSISFLEISIKYSLQKLDLINAEPDKLPELVLKNGYSIEEPNVILFASLYKLPNLEHRDPFDRLLIWEAINRNYYFLSRDSQISEYQNYGLKLLQNK